MENIDHGDDRKSETKQSEVITLRFVLQQAVLPQRMILHVRHCDRRARAARTGDRVWETLARKPVPSSNLMVQPLNSKPDIGTLARFNKSCLLEDYLRAFKIFEKPLPLTKQDRHDANLQFIHKSSL